MKILTIARWAETFENADTRKRQRLKFFHAPSGCDSSGYVELMTCHGSAGIMAFGVFQALCQHAATMQSKLRGRFVKTNGSAMSLKQVALLLRMEICHVEEAVEILMSEGIGWLRWEDVSGQSASHLPEICQSSASESAADLPPTAGFVQGEGKGKGQGEGEGKESAPARPASPRETAEDWSTSMPTETANDFAKLQSWINSLHRSWRDRPHFTAQEMRELQANGRIFFDLIDADKRLLEAYMPALIPDDWVPKFWQPDIRGKFITSVVDVLSHADRWKRECKKRRVATGLETQVAGGVQ